MGDEHSINRREALKKAAVVGAVVWSTPVIQSVSSRANAQTVSPNNICSKFRIEGGSCTTVGAQSCLPSLSDQNCCDPINTAVTTPMQTPENGEWVICLDAGCEVEGVGLKAAT